MKTQPVPPDFGESFQEVKMLEAKQRARSILEAKLGCPACEDRRLVLSTYPLKVKCQNCGYSFYPICVQDFARFFLCETRPVSSRGHVEFRWRSWIWLYLPSFIRKFYMMMRRFL